MAELSRLAPRLRASTRTSGSIRVAATRCDTRTSSSPPRWRAHGFRTVFYEAAGWPQLGPLARAGARGVPRCGEGLAMARLARSRRPLAGASSRSSSPATGWLYLGTAGRPLPGPAVHDGLPLDELSRHAKVPLLLFLGVWVFAGALLGALARWARTERLTAALLLVPRRRRLQLPRQRPLDPVRPAGAPATPPSGPRRSSGPCSSRPRSPGSAARCSVAPGRLGRPRRRSCSAGRSPAVGLARAARRPVAPAPYARSFAAFAPEAAHGLSKGLVAPLSIALLVAARRLVRRQHRAWQVALGLLAALTLLHAARRFDQGALVAGLATVALLARRSDFRFRGDPPRSRGSSSTRSSPSPRSPPTAS